MSVKKVRKTIKIKKTGVPNQLKAVRDTLKVASENIGLDSNEDVQDSEYFNRWMIGRIDDYVDIVKTAKALAAGVDWDTLDNTRPSDTVIREMLPESFWNYEEKLRDKGSDKAPRRRVKK